MKCLFLVIAMLAPMSALADEGTKVTFNSTVLSRFIHDDGLVLYNEPVCQSDITIVTTLDAYMDLWVSKGLSSDWGQSSGDEIDPALGWAGSLYHFDIDLGVGCYFTATPSGLIMGGVVSHLKIGHALRGFNVFGNIENIVPSASSGYAAGNLSSLELNKTTEFEYCSIETAASVLYDDGLFGLEKGFLWKAGVKFAWKCTENLSFLAPQILFSNPINVSDRGKEVVLSEGFEYKF
jgi:hypothetical protein